MVGLVLSHVFRNRHPKPLPHCLVTKSKGKMRLPNTGRSKEDHILGIVNKSKRGKITNYCWVEGWLKAHVKVL